MQSTARFIRKNLITFCFSLLILLIVNLIIFTYWGYSTLKLHDSIINPNMMNDLLVSEINKSNSPIIIDEKVLNNLKENNIWAMIIDDKTGKVIWGKDLPKEIPTNYSRKDVALFTRYYLKDYPVFTYINNNKGLLVLGYPKDSYAKLPTNGFPLQLLRNLPISIIYYLLFNLIIIFIIYIISKGRLLKSINPITNSICRISNGEKIQLEEKGDLLDIKIAINETSKQLKERDSMRANWIAGISHDIRTPLSLIIAYANRLSESKHLNDAERKELRLIQSNSTQIQDLISNLNLTSRLEYNLVPMERKSISIIKLLREIIVDYMNQEEQNPYEFNFVFDNISSFTMVYGDIKLLERAFRNLILNSIKHNSKGCQIQIEVNINSIGVNVDISDNGIGVSEEQLISINSSVTEYIKNNNKAEKSHGLGLLIVKQIIGLHQGHITFTSIEKRGFSTKITLPVYRKS